MSRGLENIVYQERLEQLVKFSQEKILLKWGVITIFKYKRGYHKADGDRLFFVSTEDRTKITVLTCKKEIWSGY